jgi:hypothetical protein
MDSSILSPSKLQSQHLQSVSQSDLLSPPRKKSANLTNMKINDSKSIQANERISNKAPQLQYEQVCELAETLEDKARDSSLPKSHGSNYK